MRDVVIIGGGLSGMAAAWELEKLGVDYTIIEVKNRLGGNIVSERKDGFVLDGGPFMMRYIGDWSFLDDLELQEAVFTADQPTGEYVAFKDGTQVLVDALKKRITGPVMFRMAVSSLGRVDDRFGVCLENGLVLDAKALIVAAPARYAERMFYSLQPEIGERLLRYHYDHITRISLGYRSEDIPLPIRRPGLRFLSLDRSPQPCPRRPPVNSGGHPFRPQAH
jgi:protoporphyrinogen oxidase